MDQRVFEACFAQLKAGKWHKTQTRVWCTQKHGIVVVDAQSGRYLLEVGGRSTDDSIVLEVTQKQVAMKAGQLDIAFKFMGDDDTKAFVAELQAKIPHALSARLNRRKKPDRAGAHGQAKATDASVAQSTAPVNTQQAPSVSSRAPTLLDVSPEDLPDPSCPASQQYLMSLLCDPLFVRFTTQVRCVMQNMHARTQTSAPIPTTAKADKLRQSTDSSSGSETDDGGSCAQPQPTCVMPVSTEGDRSMQERDQGSSTKRDQRCVLRLLPPSSCTNIEPEPVSVSVGKSSSSSSQQPAACSQQQ